MSARQRRRLLKRRKAASARLTSVARRVAVTGSAFGVATAVASPLAPASGLPAVSYTADVVLDLRAGSSGGYPNGLTPFGTKAVFSVAYGPNAGTWITDGTAGGSTKLVDEHSYNGYADDGAMAVMGGELYFGATDGTATALWKTDGTPSGTAKVTSIPGVDPYDDLSNLTAVGNRLYFVVDDGANGRELWSSDGSAGGTALVKDIRAGTAGSRPQDLTAVGGTLFFTADDGVNDRELWQSDGTPGGTAKVTSTPTYSSITNLTEFGGQLYFSSSYDPIYGTEIWRTNGVSTTVLDLNPGNRGSYPRGVTSVSGSLYFTTFDGAWKSDGTVGGSVKLASVDGEYYADGSPFVAIGSTLFFGMDTAEHGTELWKTNGTPAGTAQVADLALETYSSSPRDLTAVGGTLFFTADDGVRGRELWQSDGTATGTRMVKDISAGNSRVQQLTNVNGNLLFVARDATFGNELWKTAIDPTPASYPPPTPPVTPAPIGALLADIAPGAPSSRPAQFTAFNGKTFFSANDGLWQTDGTGAGTQRVSTARPSYSYYTDSMVAAGGTLFFAGRDAVVGNALWKSDGTAAGTVLVKDLNPGSSAAYASTPYNLTAVGSTVYFTVDDGTHGQELWRSDGSAAGTVLVADIRAGAGDSYPRDLTAFNGKLYFTATDGTTGRRLWRADVGGATSITDPNSQVSELTAGDSHLYFAADSGTSGREPWRTDGTDAGEQTIDLVTGPGSSYPRSMIAVGGTLYVAGSEGVWRVNSPTSFTQLTTATPYSYSYTGSEMVALGGSVFFTATSDGTGEELWSTDGTVVGTKVVRDIKAGDASSQPRSLVTSGGKVYFTAKDGGHGRELWVSDGSPAGTRIVADVRTGTRDGNVGDMFDLNGQLLFAADDGARGKELWTTGTAAPPPTPTPPLTPTPTPTVAPSIDPPTTTPPTVADTAVSGFVTTARTTQKQRTKVKVAVKLGGAEALTSTGTGTIKASSTKAKILPVTLKTAPGGTGTMSLTVSKKAAPAILKAVAKYRKAPASAKKKLAVKAKITIVGRDAAGNQTSKTLTVTLV